MREHRPSFTASAVALARGLADDPCAERLLPLPMAVLLRALRGVSRGGRLGAPVVSALTAGVADHITLRTAEIDEAVREGVARRIEQVIILGAGLDARAYRMEELHRAVVFEVDHAATQQYKRSKVVDLPPRARAVRFAEIDFERDTLSEVLAQAGHDADVPSLWIWEGVTPYLAPEAIRGALAQLEALSAPGSLLLMTYVTPEMTSLRMGSRLVSAAFDVIGEPLRGLMSKEHAAGELARAGFRLVSDTSPVDWARRWGHPRSWPLLISERLVIAERGTRGRG